MFVLCPHCQFLVTVDPLSGEPPARCPRCDEALAVAPAHATDVEAPATPIAAARDVALSPTDGAPLQPPEAVPQEAAPAPFPPSTEAAAADVVHGGPAPVAQPCIAPSAAAPARADAVPVAAARWRMSEGWIIAALAVLLALQLLLANRATLAADARWRPALALACGVLRCMLPPWREPAAFTLLDRDVTPDPRQPGVLRVTGRFRNDARWPQPWPKLLLALSDADGRVAGERAFAPADYRAGDATENQLGSGQIATFRIAVIEPAPRTVAFTFDFR